MTRTLLVDSDPERRTRLEQLLQQAGHEVAVANDTANAQQAVDSMGPDLVVVALAAEKSRALLGLARAFEGATLATPARTGRSAALAAGRPTLSELERRYALEILRETGGNKTRAAEILGIDRKTLYRLIDETRGAP